ncbi:MAG: hypothetical protein ABSF46_10980 [Terriglobia bacterium]|jgi:hypothetical protein
MTPRTRLFDLLPALYRLKDAQVAASQQLAQGPLQSLLALIEEQLSVVENDLEQLYDDQFIETCAPWVIPYIGDLIGYQPVNGVAPAVASPRAEVAHTISFRRRKGTVLVLEQLARDVTGWGAHAVEFFKLLACSQYMHHIRPHNYYAPDLRHWQVRAYMDTAFDRTAHNVDVRRIAVERGRYNLQNIGIFLWSLGAYSLTKIPATPSPSNSAGKPQCYRFSPLGRDISLFTNPISQGSQINSAATPVNVPDRLRRRVLCQDLASGAGAVYYGEGNSLAIYAGGKLLNPYQIQVCDLAGAEGSWANLPSGNSYPYAAAVDPELGRIALAPVATGSEPVLEVSFYYGFNAEMGGGEYSRQQTFVVQSEAQVLPFPDTASAPRYHTLQDAVTYAAAQLTANGKIALELSGSGSSQAAYELPAALSVSVPASATLEIRGADGSWPMLTLNGEISASGGALSTLVFNGLLLTSKIAPGNPPVALLHVPATAPSGSSNQLGTLAINHCTLVPGWALAPSGSPQYGAAPALVAAPSGLQISIQRSIVGALRVEEVVTASVADSVVDATSRTNVAYSASDGAGAGGALTLEGCTVVGKIHAGLLTLVSDSIVWAGLASGDAWAAPLVADRKQAGCVRFSYLPMASVTPRQFQCLEQGEGAPQPVFYSLRYGDPGYAKLLPSTDNAIRQGADDGGEMGAFHFVLAPQRETDLRVRLQEYTPAGLEFGIFYET